MHRLCPMMIAALLVGAVVSNALAQPAHDGDRQLALPAA